MGLADNVRIDTRFLVTKLKPDRNSSAIRFNPTSVVNFERGGICTKPLEIYPKERTLIGESL